MSNHSATVTLEHLAHMLGNVAADQLALKQQIADEADAAKLRDNRLQGELRALRGELVSLAGKAEAQAGLIVTLTSSVEELERNTGKVVRKFAEIEQALEGVTSLCSTNFDQNVSILEALTGAKGADRPKRQSRSGSEPNGD